jgi:flagellar biosynthetic protein FliP
VTRRTIQVLGILLLGLAASAVLVLLPAGAASADPTSVAARGIARTASSGTPVAAPLASPVRGIDVRTPDVPGPKGPNGPQGTGTGSDTSVTVDLGGLTNKPSTSVTVIIALTLLSLLPAILLTCTSFTKILVVLGLTRNALGLQQTPPNQVLAGLALFLSLFIMAPVLSSINDAGVQPYLHGTKTSAQAYQDGVKPLKTFMLDHTDKDELTLLTSVAKRDLPKNKDDVSMATLVPAFVLSELKQAFIIGFIVFIPFLVIDIVVSGALMALGMMMMPPVMVSLPFKLLLFVLVDGWGLVIRSVVASYGTG